MQSPEDDGPLRRVKSWHACPIFQAVAPRIPEDVVAGAEELQTAIRTSFITKLPAQSMLGFREDLSGFVVRFILERQCDAIRAAVALTRVSLGHLALPYVRPACEERIWVAYLYSLDIATRDRLLLWLSLLESSSTINAQLQFFGMKQMRRLGFSKSFVREQHKLGASADTELLNLGRLLDWPEPRRGPPSVGWVASQSNLDKLYSFLYPASSKGVHFSPAEAMRSGWESGPGQRSVVTMFAKPYVKYRTAFSIYWLCALLMQTLGVLWELGPLAGIELDNKSAIVIDQALAKVGVIGEVPIALACEYNLTTGD